MKRQGDAKVDRTESTRQKRRAELLETLRRLFNGVVSDVTSVLLLHLNEIFSVAWSRVELV